jgi:AsmA protein
MKALKILGATIAAIVIAVLVLLVVGIPSGFLTSTIADRVERDTGYHLTIAGSTRIGLGPSLNVTMNDVTLEGPADRDTGNRLSVGSIQADITLGSLWAGRPEITELLITRPTVSIPLRRERRAAKGTSPKPGTATDKTDASAPTIQRVVVTDGTVIFFNTHDHVENRIEGISLRAVIGADRRVNLNGDARAGGHPLSFDIKAAMPDPSPQRQTLPVELSFNAPDLLRAPISSKAEVRLAGTTVMINGLSGVIGDGAFDGWASVDFASKPVVKIDLDFRRLDLATASSQATPPAASTTWSNAPLELNGLNYVDAQVRLSAAELNIGSAHFAPAAIEASLTSGIFKGVVTNLGAYGGQANATIGMDVSLDRPMYTLRCDLNGVRALPLLSSAADFDKLDGRLQARIDVRSNGQSQQAILSNLAGTAVANFQDGAIRGLNVAQMIRSLTSTTLSGWQENREQTTDLTQLSASFSIENGKATTSDLNLVGPLVKMTGTGTIDIGAKMLALKVEPKLVMTTEGQGRASDPVGFGIPVAIEGPWATPRIYPDMAGMLDNPDAAYAQLKQMGTGLFAPGGLGGSGQSDALRNKLGETLGNLLQQGLGTGQGRNNAPSASPNDSSAPTQNNPSQPAKGAPPVGDILKQLFGR